MKTVILYLRVSTDEQAEKGFSLPAQEDKLRKFCEAKGYTILKVFTEDYSAWKGFDRPEYNKLKAFLREHKDKVDGLLFTQWSRFSRDISESLAEIKALKKLGITATAAEQWVDMSVPENLYMQAFYLAAPQVENDRLSLRTKAGMRQAMKQGRWMCIAPYGYLNDKVAKIIVPDPATKDIVIFAFNTFATGAYTMEDVRRLCMERGAKLHKQKFINLLSNPFYAGKFLLKATEEEAATYITGIHEPLITWETFERVQLFYKKRKKAYQSHTRPKLFYLKGHLICPKCGKLMTGSASKGNGGLYAYYHCQRKYGCTNTYPLTKVESAFNELLGTFKVSEEVISLYAQVLEDVFKTNDKQRDVERLRLEKDVANIKVKIKDLDERLMNNSLPIERYNRLVHTMEDQQTEYLMQLTTLSQSKSEYARYLYFGLSFLADVDTYYEQASPETKKRIIGSIFPEKLTFDGTSYRTTRVNELFALICSGDKGLTKRKPGKKAGQSYQAPLCGLEPKNKRS